MSWKLRPTEFWPVLNSVQFRSTFGGLIYIRFLIKLTTRPGPASFLHLVFRPGPCRALSQIRRFPQKTASTQTTLSSHSGVPNWGRGNLSVFALKTAAHQLICCSSVSPCLSECWASCLFLSLQRQWKLFRRRSELVPVWHCIAMSLT